jgi:hypothetical protein
MRHNDTRSESSDPAAGLGKYRHGKPRQGGSANSIPGEEPPDGTGNSLSVKTVQ